MIVHCIVSPSPNVTFQCLIKSQQHIAMPHQGITAHCIALHHSAHSSPCGQTRLQQQHHRHQQQPPRQRPGSRPQRPWHACIETPGRRHTTKRSGKRRGGIGGPAKSGLHFSDGLRALKALKYPQDEDPFFHGPLGKTPSVAC